MPGHRPGHPRNVLFVILMSAFTAGIYWLYWTRKAYEEIARQEETKTPRALWSVSVATYLLAASVAIGAGYFGGDYPARMFNESIEAQTTPLLLADAAATALYIGVELAYVWGATVIFRRALERVNLPSPSIPLLVVASVLLAAQGVPRIGFIAGLAGGLLWIIWVVQTQLAMNLYWKELEARHWLPTSDATNLARAPPIDA